MIWRIWTLLLVVIVGGAWLLAVPYSPAPEVKTASVIDIYRAKGLVPETGAMTMSLEVGHDVFELPAADAEHRQAMMAAGGMAMSGGDHAMEAMPGMAKEGATPAQPGAAKKGDHAMEAMPGMAKEGETPAQPGAAKKGDHAMEAMPGMGKEPGHGTIEPGAAAPHRQADEGDGRGGVEAGLTILAVGAKEIAAFYGRGGSAVKAAIDMREWRFEQDTVMAKAGDVIHLVVRNTGQMPHEFMVMDQAGMGAVDYRRQRADWSLLEHKAIYEVPVLMPGDGVEMIVKIHKSGMWMYMCMFPYHMQLGMMGMLMTPDMMGKGGMRM